MPAKHGRCAHCQAVGRLTGPHCPACWDYQRRHHALPPTAVLVLRETRRRPSRCCTCGVETQPGHRKNWRCPVCAAYWQAHHTERPPRLWSRPVPLRRAGPRLPQSGCPACGDRPVLVTGYCSDACRISAELGA